MSRIIITLLAAVAFFQLSAAASDQFPSIRVSGIVHGLSGEAPRTLLVDECDISDKSRRCVAELDSAGHFDVSLPFYYGHTFAIIYDRDLCINAYAEPGDSIFVDIDLGGAPIEFHVAGDHATLNEEYSHARDDLSTVYGNVTLPSDTVALAVYLPAFKNEVERTGAIVDQYIRDKSLQPETAELLRLDNLFFIANMAIGFRGKSREEQTAFFTDPMFDISNDRNVRVMIFPFHLSALMFSNPEYVRTMPRSIVRDLMYAILKEDEKPSRDDFMNSMYYDRLYALSGITLDFSRLKAGRIAVLESDSVSNIEYTDPIGWLKNRFPSRPIYLDISATWCGPCRASLTHSEDIRQYFAGSDLVFAVIWLKSDMDTWMTLAPKFHNAIHIFIPDEDMSNRIMDTLNVKGFPSYYFIDRAGTMSKDGVPHFHDPQLVDFLRSRL